MRNSPRRFDIVRVLAFVTWSLMIAGCTSPVANLNSMGKGIVCFGDSLTEGYGTGEGEDYPSRLGDFVDEEVINAGRSGETSEQGLSRIEADVLAHRPRLVIVEFGANDAFQRVPLKETVGNIEAMITKIQRQGAMVALVSVKMGLFSDAYVAEYRKLAQRKHAIYIPDIMKGVFFDPRLKSDQIHPNAEGYAVIAEKIFQKIKPVLKRK